MDRIISLLRLWKVKHLFNPVTGNINLRIKSVLLTSLALISFVLVIWVITLTVLNSNYWDFNVFYSSARMAIQGENIYRNYGQFELPFWYFPWTAWFFIPLAIFQLETAAIIFLIISLICAFSIVYTLGRRLNLALSTSSMVFISSITLLICWLLFRVGQIDFVLVAFLTGSLFLIDKNRNFEAGIFFPIFLIKPHLLLIFIPFIILRGGWRYFLTSAGMVFLLGIIAFILQPGWPVEMVRMLTVYGQRINTGWNFMTFSELIGRTENWAGTANMPVTLLLALLAFFITWRYRHLPTIPLLSIALSASLFCAPRAYSYNLPFLIPSLLWLTAEMSNNRLFFIWILIGFVAVASGFSTGTYLIVLATFICAVIKAEKTIQGQYLQKEYSNISVIN